MELFLVFLGNGIVVGSMYALLAVGLSWMFSIMRLVNFAHGELYMVGSYIAWVVVTNLGFNYWLGFLLAVIAGGLLGYIIEKLAFRPVYSGKPIAQFIVSLGLVIVLQEVIFITFTGLQQGMPTPYPTVRTIGKFSITDQRLIVVGITLVLVIAIFLFFKRARIGKAMRATAGNKLAAGMVGIKIQQMASLSFIAGAGLAAVAGALLAPLFNLSPFMGTRLTGVAFVVIIIGGMGSIGGAIIVGFTIGILENLFSGYVASEWVFAVAFTLLILVLMFRPMGLFGKERAG